MIYIRHLGAAPLGSLERLRAFVVANFTRAELRRLPTDGTHIGKSVIWLTHV
jgi:hypothetical protein